MWTKPGLLTAADRRRLYVKWLSEVWEEIDQRQSMITRAFQQCGMLNAADGSEDHLIRIQGYDGPYSVDGEIDDGNDSDFSELGEGEDEIPGSDSSDDSSDDE